MITQITGDLLAVTEGIILHQVNAMGVTGGLAGALRRKHPSAFKCYADLCKRIGRVDRDALVGNLALGIASWKDADHERWKLLIGHVFGQETPGPHTSMKAVDIALARLAKQLQRDEFNDAPVYAPHLMGCGLGGGDWPTYSALIEKHLPQCIIVKLPEL